MIGEREGGESDYAEREHEERAAVGKQLEEEGGDGAASYRRRLFELRCEGGKDPGKLADRLLWQCLNLTEIYNARYLFRGSARREVLSELNALGYGEASEYGEAGEEALYREIRNAVSRYLKTCSDPGYRRLLFGLMSSSERDRKHQVCLDIWKMTEGLSGKYGLEDELRIWNRAVLDQYFAEVPEGRSMMAKIREENGAK